VKEPSFREREEEAELLQLWSARQNLDKASWVRLWELVRLTLRSAGSSELRDLPGGIDDREEYIDQFFLKKVLEPALPGAQLSPLKYKNILIIYFRRYLLDCIDKNWLEHIDDDQEKDEEYDKNLPEPRNLESAGQVVGGYLSTVEVNLLHEATSLSLDDTQVAAHTFLNTLENWALIYLRNNTCINSEDGLRPMPLYQIKESFQISNYHDRARGLGITRKKGEFEKGYEKTLIGTWLVSLGLPPRRENISAILVALKILCHEALKV